MMEQGYGQGVYFVPGLTRDMIFEAIKGNPGSYQEIIQYLNSFDIPKNGNRGAALWDESDTPITYALFLAETVVLRWENDRRTNLIRILYNKCGVPVYGEGAGTINPLNICVRYDIVSAAKVLLEETDACFDPPQSQKELLYFLVANRRSEMLRLFSRFKERTFPLSKTFLNSEGGGSRKNIPLFQAVLNDDPETVRILIRDFGANPYIQDCYGRTPIDLIRRVSRADTIRPWLQPAERVHALAMSRSPRSILDGHTSLGHLPDEIARRINSHAELRKRLSF